MLKTTDRGSTLRDHLNNDHFFENGQDTLNIIDDYNIIDISREAINFYRESFEGTGLRHIKIFFQIKPLQSGRLDEVLSLSQQFGVLGNELLSFIILLHKSFYPKERSLNSFLFAGSNRNKNMEKIQKALEFMHTMQEIGITVELQPYSSLNFHPPFHGRYWINENAGYIVDASLQTFGHGLIFAQLMDTENYRIIKEQLFDLHVVRACEGYRPLNLDSLEELNRRIFGNHF